MGVDKADLVVAGKPLVAYALEALSSMRPSPVEIIVATSPAGGGLQAALLSGLGTYAGASTPTFVADELPHLGPLAGLHTLLRAARTPVVVTLACDAPYISARLLDLLLDNYLGEPEVPAALFEAGGRVFPFPGVYSASLVPLSSRLLSGQDRAVRALLDRIEVRRLPLPEWAPEFSLDSLNTPDDLRLAEERLATPPNSE